jgi:X-X-X-Leu-X-X-Gly heptad repeat protein
MKANFSQLKANFSQLKANFSQLKANLSQLKANFSQHLPIATCGRSVNRRPGHTQRCP